MQLIDKKFSGSLKANRVLALFLLGFFSRTAAIAQTPGTFTRTGDMTTMRENHTTTLLPDGRVLIAGGVAASFSSITNTAELYDPITGVFTPTGEMTTPRRSHAATLLPDGRVLIAGGFGPLAPHPWAARRGYRLAVHWQAGSCTIHAQEFSPQRAT